MRYRKNNNVRLPYTQIVLHTITLAGMISMAVLAPNAIQAFELFGYTSKKHGQHKTTRKHIQDSVRQAMRTGLVACGEVDGEHVYFLTKKGEDKLHQYEVRDLSERDDHVPVWDGVWRIVMFDVQERRREKRDWLRRELTVFGFQQLQRSVWIYPYACEEFITLLKTNAQFGKDVIYMEVNRIEGDAMWRSLFGLKTK